MTDLKIIYQYLEKRGVALKTARSKQGTAVVSWTAPVNVPAGDVVPLLRSHKADLYAYLVEIEEQAAIFEESGSAPDIARCDAVRCVNARRESDALGSLPCIKFEGDAELIKFVAAHPAFRSIESLLLNRGGATVEVLRVA